MDAAWISLIPLHVALPLLGALLFLVLRRWGPVPARAVVMTNVVASLLLGLLLIGLHLQYRESGDTLDRPSASIQIPWMHDAGNDEGDRPDRSLSFAVDGASVWFLVSIPLVILCVLASEPAEAWTGRPLPVVGLLVAESASLAVFVARDVVLICAALGLLSGANFLVVGSRGSPVVRSTARIVLLQHLAGTALISAALVGTVVACSHLLGAPNSPPAPAPFDLDALIGAIQRAAALSPPAGLVWRQISPWLFLSLLAGCGAWSGLFPCHLTLAAAMRETSLAGRALLGAVVLKVGVWVLIRVGLPLFPAVMTELGPFLILAVMLAALYCATAMNAFRVDPDSPAAEASPRPAMADLPFLAEGAIVCVLLAVCGVLSQSETAVTGAVLLLLGHVPCWMLYTLLMTAPQSVAGRDEQPGARWLVLFSLAGMPGLALFPGLLLLFLGISISPATFAAWLAILILFWLVIAMSAWVHVDQARTCTSPAAGRAPSVRFAIILLSILMILTGIASPVLTAPIREAVLELIQR